MAKGREIISAALCGPPLFSASFIANERTAPLSPGWAPLEHADRSLSIYAENSGEPQSAAEKHYMLVLESLTERVIGLAIDVHRELGPGLLEVGL
jgi:hypothetical protein